MFVARFWNYRVQRLAHFTVLFALLLLPGCSRTPPPTTQVVSDSSAITDSAQSAPPADPGKVEKLPDDPGPTVSVEDAVAPDTVGDNACAEDVGIRMYDGEPQQELPELKTRVTDKVDVLTPECVRSLTARLKKLEDDKGAQLAVLLVNSTDGEGIDSYASKVFAAWKLGRKGIDDGVLLVVAMEDRHARIEVGYGLEGVLTDGITGDILRANLRQNFADKQYSAGVSATVDALVSRIEAAPSEAVKPKRSNKTAQWVFFFVMIALCIAAGAVGAALNLKWYYRVLLPPVVSTVCVLIGVPLHLTPGYATIIAMIPASLAFSVPGILLVRATRQVLQWLGCWIGASTLIGVVVAVVGYVKGVDGTTITTWLMTCFPVGLFVGTLIFMLAFVIRGGTRIRGSNWPDRRDDDSSSRSSSDDSSSSSSSSSDSDSFSGGGGSSGGGGASTDW
jgi:uncharacterized protein